MIYLELSGGYREVEYQVTLGVIVIVWKPLYTSIDMVVYSPVNCNITHYMIYNYKQRMGFRMITRIVYQI